MPNYVGGTGSITAKLVIVGEAPGKHEDETGIPFAGPTGEMLNQDLQAAGISRSEVYLTNVVKYRPPMNDLDKLHLINVDIKQSIKELWIELRTLKPNCILAVGDLALNAVCNLDGILTYRGSILRSRDGDLKVVPTIHWAALFSRGDQGGLDYVYRKIIQHDVKRAVEESQTSNLDLPDRELIVARNSLDVHRFFERFRSERKAANDIESINCIPVCTGFAFNRRTAISIPLLKQVGKHSLTAMGYDELAECWRVVDEKLRTLEIVGQNYKYDEFKQNKLGFRIPNVVSDTLIKTRVLFPELPSKRLDVQASIWTREPYYKTEGKEFALGKTPIEQLFKYNAKDCTVTKEIDEEQEIDLYEMQELYQVPLVDYYYKYQMKKHKWYLEMENNGFAVDAEQKRKLLIKYTGMAAVVHDRMTELVGHEVNVKSYPQVYRLLYEEMRLRKMKLNPTSEDTIVALMGNHAKKKEQKDILESLLEERRIRDQKSRYISFRPDFDGRCKTSFNIIATETCRSSTSILDKPVRPIKIGQAFHTISKHGRLAKDIRSMFIADRGKVLIQADASQCQARIVAVLSEDWDLLKAFDEIDIHKRTAGLIFQLTPGLVLKKVHVPMVDDMDKDDPMRFTGKKVRHAGNFDMGKRRFMTEFNTDAQKFEIRAEISEWKAGQMLEMFHAGSPKLRSVFHADIINCIQSSRVIIDPYGGVRVFNGRMDEETYKEGYANIPQRTEAHLIQTAALKTSEECGDCIGPIGKAPASWISENHDSLLLQAPENDWEPYARILKKYMETPIDFSTYCSLKRNYKLTIPCDVEISDTTWGAMRKAKL